MTPLFSRLTHSVGLLARTRNALPMAWVLTTLTFLGLWGWALRPTQPIVREKVLVRTEPIGEIRGAYSASQAFLAPFNGLYRIEVSLADYGRLNTGAIYFRLSAAPDASQPLILKTFRAEEIRGDRRYAFEFEPLPNSAGQTYYFQIEAPGAVPGNAITAYVSRDGSYRDGAAYYAGQPIAGNLVFAAHFKTDLWSATTYWLMRLKAQKPYLWGQMRLYIGVLAAYLLVVVALIHQLAKIKGRDQAS